MKIFYFFKSFLLKVASCFFFLILSTSIFGQDIEKLKDFFTFYPNHNKVQKDTNIYAQKIIIAPVLSYAPETNLGFGTGVKYLFKLNKSGEETRVSNMPMTLQYTLNKQFFLYSGFEIFTNQERWVIEGNLLFQSYPRLYYGIGNETPKSAEELYDYFQLLFEPIFLKRVFHRFLFLGAGIRYNKIFNTEIEPDGLIATNQPDGYDGSTSIGLEFGGLFDSRSNILNAQDGWYVKLTHGEYKRAIGSTHNFNLSRFDLRHYLAITKNEEDILAFQLMGQFSRGNIPFSEYSFLGGKEIMRGYKEGRYIDRDLVAFQTEYRKHFKNSRWGAVAFLGLGEVGNHIKNFRVESLKYNFGLGARFMIDKEERLNLRFDFGVGKNTKGIYLGIAEAF